MSSGSESESQSDSQSGSQSKDGMIKPDEDGHMKFTSLVELKRHIHEVHFMPWCNISMHIVFFFSSVVVVPFLAIYLSAACILNNTQCETAAGKCVSKGFHDGQVYFDTVDRTLCPETCANLPDCKTADFGDICEGIGECGTSTSINNCCVDGATQKGYDVYRKRLSSEELFHGKLSWQFPCACGALAVLIYVFVGITPRSFDFCRDLFPTRSWQNIGLRFFLAACALLCVSNWRFFLDMWTAMSIHYELCKAACADAQFNDYLVQACEDNKIFEWPTISWPRLEASLPSGMQNISRREVADRCAHIFATQPGLYTNHLLQLRRVQDSFNLKMQTYYQVDCIRMLAPLHTGLVLLFILIGKRLLYLRDRDSATLKHNFLLFELDHEPTTLESWAKTSRIFILYKRMLSVCSNWEEKATFRTLEYAEQRSRKNFSDEGMERNRNRFKPPDRHNTRIIPETDADRERLLNNGVADNAPVFGCEPGTGAVRCVAYIMSSIFAFMQALVTIKFIRRPSDSLSWDIAPEPGIFCFFHVFVENFVIWYFLFDAIINLKKWIDRMVAFDGYWDFPGAKSWDHNYMRGKMRYQDNENLNNCEEDVENMRSQCDNQGISWGRSVPRWSWNCERLFGDLPQLGDWLTVRRYLALSMVSTRLNAEFALAVALCKLVPKLCAGCINLYLYWPESARGTVASTSFVDLALDSFMIVACVFTVYLALQLNDDFDDHILLLKDLSVHVRLAHAQRSGLDIAHNIDNSPSKRSYCTSHSELGLETPMLPEVYVTCLEQKATATSSPCMLFGFSISSRLARSVVGALVLPALVERLPALMMYFPLKDLARAH